MRTSQPGDETMYLHSRWFPILIACIALIIGLHSQVVNAAGGYSQNLILNPGAEDSQGSPTGAVTDVPSWKRTGAFTAVQYDASAFPSSKDPGPPDRGKNFFAGGPSVERSTGTQQITLVVPATDIDAGIVKYVLSGWLGGYQSQNDHATVTATFVNQSGTPLGHAVIGPVMASDRGNNTEFLERSTTGLLPKGTRSVVVTMTMVRTDGDYNDGYVDNLSLVLNKR
jgi:hypothetical protein